METKFFRIPPEAHKRMVAFRARMTIKPSRQSLMGAVIDFALDNELAFIAYLASVRSDEAGGDTTLNPGSKGPEK